MTKTSNATAKAPATKAARKPATKLDPDLIRSSKGSTSGEKHHVTSNGGETLTFPTALWAGEVRSAAKPGNSMKALKALVATKKATAMASGVTARTAPQSAKAFSDSKPATKAAKAAKPAKASSKRDSKVTLLVKPEDSGVKGGRLARLRYMWKAKPATVADVLGKTVLDDGGKESTIDMGAINGMLRRNHIALS